MAWGSLQNYYAIQWSAAALLDASVEVVVAFLVLVCAILNCSTASFIRVSGRFRIPCSCCAHLRTESSSSAVEESEDALVLSKSKSIVDPVESEVRLNGIDHSDDCLTVGGLRPVNPYALSEIIPCEFPLEVRAEREEAAPVYASSSQSGQGNEDLNDRSQEDVERDQHAKAQELLRALQTEREAMAALYSELEEERNSSATAASEALAMISRLQEEKAAIQMEYRQFQRMVMEKAMYDQEAIEVLKEILAKREEERIEWEEEIRLYKDRLNGVLMEERDYAERVGSDYVPMLPLEGIPKDLNSTSPKSEQAEGLAIISNGRLAKDEDAGFLDRLSKTGSQLLTALRLEGVPEPASALVEDSASSVNESLKSMAKFPVRAESPPVLDHEYYKAALGLGAIMTSREIGPPISLAVSKKQTAKALRKDASDEPVSLVSREPTPPLAVAKKKNENARVTKDHPGKGATNEPVFASRERSPPTISKEQIEKVQVGKDAEKTADESALGANREIILPVPPKKQTEKALVVRDAGKASTDQPGIASSEVSLPILPPKKQNEKTLVKDDADEEPEFVNLKRRWSSRGSQEVSVEVLAKAKEDRRIEEKRLSVLEYVRNLEEQLQQQARRPAVQLARAKSVDGREEDTTRCETPDILESSSGSSGGSRERDESSPQRILSVDGNSVDEEPNASSFLGEGDTKQYSFRAESDSKVSNDEGEVYANAGKPEVSPDEALFVHDVYEVQQNHPHEASSRLGVWVAGTMMSGLELLSPVSDRLGKPDNLNVEEEATRINEERETLSSQREGEDFGFESQWKHLQRRAQCNDLTICTLLREENCRSLMEEEIEQLTQRLKALEADRYLMKQTIDSLRRENGEMKLVQEIAHQLRELQGMEQKELQITDFLPQILNFEVGASEACASTCKKRRYNSTPRGSSCRPGTEMSRASSRSYTDVGS